MTKKDFILKELKKIERKQGYINPADVVEAAKNPRNILHSYFEWNNKKAGYEYRLWQARQLVARVRIEYVGRETDAYWNARIKMEDVDVQGYFSTEKVFSDQYLKTKVIEAMLTDILALKKKYKEFKEIDEIISSEALERVSSKLRP